MKKYLVYILFYGSLWGFLEATIGHVLHFIPWTIAGAIMFPIASAILVKAYIRLDSRVALFYIATVAAAIKSVDLFLPALSVYKTINPMIAFFFEAALVVAVIPLVMKNTLKSHVLAMQVASISWRALFIGYMGLQYILSGNLAPYISDIGFAYEFLIVQGIISGLLATGLYYGYTYLSQKEDIRLKIHPIISVSLFVAAVVATYLL